MVCGEESLPNEFASQRSCHERHTIERTTTNGNMLFSAQLSNEPQNSVSPILQKESDLPLRVNQAQRIELPIYFNTPKRKEDIISKKRLIEKNKGLEKKAI